MTWPPEGFVPAPSALAGVEVWQPGPVDRPLRPSCPRCGAPAGWDPGRARFGCSRCAWSEALVEVGDGPGRFTRAALAAGERGWGAERGRTLHCEGCGGEVDLPPAQLATTCPFCASAQLRSVEGEPGLRPQAVVPFARDLAEAKAAAQAWLGAGWLHPASLSATSIDRMIGVYLPAWRFGARVQARWNARVGHVEHEIVHDAQGRPRQHSRVRWRREAGEAERSWSDLLVPGSTEVSEAVLLALFAEPESAVPYQPALLASFGARAFTRPLAEAWELARGRMRAEVEAACRADIHGDHVQDFSMRTEAADERWEYLLLPVYLAAYRHGGRSWQLLVHGRSGKVLGPKPVAWGRVLLLAVACLLPGLVGLLVPPVGILLLLLGGAAVVWLALRVSAALRGTG